MIGAVLELGEQRVHEVMIPRIDIKGLAVTARSGRDHRHDRQRGPLAHPGVRGEHRQRPWHPLCEGPAAALAKGTEPDIRSILRAGQLVPMRISVDDLLHSFQRSKVHIAIVLDEYSGARLAL